MGETIDNPAADPQDWITIWQSEMAALATDRECLEALATGALAWKAIHDANVARPDGSTGRAGADAPAGAEAAGAASGTVVEPVGADGLGAELERLRSRLAEFERTVAKPGGR